MSALSPLLRVCACIVLGASLVPTPAAGQPAPVVPSPTPASTANAASFLVIPGQARKLIHQGSTLDVATDSLNSVLTISVEPLSSDELPPLDTGMTNVTLAQTPGYRFKPHNTKFKNK